MGINYDNFDNGKKNRLGRMSDGVHFQLDEFFSPIDSLEWTLPRPNRGPRFVRDLGTAITSG